VFIKDSLHIQDRNVNGTIGAVTHSCLSIMLCVRGLLEKYPTFGREKETGLPGALDT